MKTTTPKVLDVYLQDRLAGCLRQDVSGRMLFAYVPDWLSDSAAMPLSLSLPLRREPFTQRECSGYFGGLLPEESARERVARNLGISARNDFAMLAAIGGDCAGAVTLIPAGDPVPAPGDYRALCGSDLATVLHTLDSRPLLAGEAGVRQSLAGAQDKLAVNAADGRIAVPLHGAPSTHILKPAHFRFDGLVFNELFCLELAGAVGLSVATAEAGTEAGMDYLLIRRFDRAVTLNPEGREQIARVHQEDFCQALGVVSQNKYQSGGGPSLRQCFALVRAFSSDPAADLQGLLDAVIFNFLVGNNDAHGKNFSLLYPQPGVTRLAPLYDLVCTASYPDLSPKMAMKLGGEYDTRRIRPRHFENLAAEADLLWPMARACVPDLASRMLESIQTMTPNPHATAVATFIQARCRKALSDFA